jgi:hypothetical protein
MSALSIILAWMVIPWAAFMVYCVVRDILTTNSEPDLAWSLHDKAFHSGHVAH